MVKMGETKIIALLTICLVALSCGDDTNECRWTARTGDVTTFNFLGNQIKIPTPAGLTEYTSSVQRLLFNLDREIVQTANGWQICLSNTSQKCKDIIQNATRLARSVSKTLQNLRNENDKMIKKVRGDESQTNCLSCIRSNLNRIFFGFLPQYWINFGLNFGVGSSSTTAPGDSASPTAATTAASATTTAPSATTTASATPSAPADASAPTATTPAAAPATTTAAAGGMRQILD